MTNAGVAGQVCRILNEKIELLQKLLAETNRQEELLAKGDLDGLAASIGARQTCMDGVDALDSCVQSAGGISTLQADSTVGQLKVDIAVLLAAIGAKDEQNLNAASKLAESYKTGIRETNAEKNLLAYHTSASVGSRYVNREG